MQINPAFGPLTPGSPTNRLTAPHFNGQTLEKPATVTLFFNNLLAHDHVELLGTTSVEPIAKYQPHPAEEPLLLQGHAGPVRFRNIWIRRLRGYDS
jgi:hypothetical protein